MIAKFVAARTTMLDSRLPNSGSIVAFDVASAYRALLGLAYAGLVAGDKIHGEEGREEREAEGNEGREIPPPTRPSRKRREQVQLGIKEDAFSLDESAVVLQWPERLRKASAEDLQDWLELIGRKIRRAAPAAPETDDVATEE